ncbi:hypothetical protein N657DRAFT_650226 [Parathielavia appendiculata]|uniref:Microbial-type PARG catalytic domain-containing protein n=1 Tax=Parathielavia appendiculata TaxID=2587402 RepID=A0AAN6YZ23_9PEZI|nr:hypothetical protein N657DRAFT_650226 [Parathielavia appendiculata]
MWRKKYYEHPRRLALAAIAKETETMTPTISSALPHLNTTQSEKMDLGTLPPLDAARCPRFKATTQTRVFNQDTFDAAIAMPSSVLNIPSDPDKATSTVEKDKEILARLQSAAASPENLNPSTAPRIAVLNMASERNPGGGWLKGASAQEEALCFRSTLAASLHRTLYPIPRRTGLYSRDVAIFRGSVSDGHKLMVPEMDPASLPVVSALSVAGIRRPEVKAEGEVAVEAAEGEGAGKTEDPKQEAAAGADSDNGVPEKQRKHGRPKGKDRTEAPKGPSVFADPADRELTKDKMRLCLRMAGTKGHTMLVLGAIGCGAFQNPPQEVAKCWQEVLSETEFAGGWFKEIWFAVYDRRNEGNYEIFKEAFDGKVIGEVQLSSTSAES